MLVSKYTTQTFNSEEVGRHFIVVKAEIMNEKNVCQNCFFGVGAFLNELVTCLQTNYFLRMASRVFHSVLKKKTIWVDSFWNKGVILYILSMPCSIRKISKTIHVIYNYRSLTIYQRNNYKYSQVGSTYIIPHFAKEFIIKVQLLTIYFFFLSFTLYVQFLPFNVHVSDLFRDMKEISLLSLQNSLLFKPVHLNI